MLGSLLFLDGKRTLPPTIIFLPELWKFVLNPNQYIFVLRDREQRFEIVDRKHQS